MAVTEFCRNQLQSVRRSNARTCRKEMALQVAAVEAVRLAHAYHCSVRGRGEGGGCAPREYPPQT